MPIYEYICKRCQHKFEELIAWEKRKTVKCDKCNKPAKRLFPLPKFYISHAENHSDAMLREQGVID